MNQNGGEKHLSLSYYEKIMKEEEERRKKERPWDDPLVATMMDADFQGHPFKKQSHSTWEQ